MPRPLFIATIAMLSTFGLLASDIYLPSMPSMKMSFQVPDWQMTQSISVYLIALAGAQLIYGPLADRNGRKPILYIGISVYIAGSLGCAASTDFTHFLIWRAMEATGAASGLVLSRTLIADICNKQSSANVYSIIYPLVSLSPALAPAIGAQLTSQFGWQSNFVFVAVFGLASLLLALFLPETRAVSIADKPSKKSAILYLVSDPAFLRYNCLVCAIYSAWFVYLTQSPFLFTQLNMSPHQIGWLYLPLTLTIISANFTSKWLLARCQYQSIVRGGLYSFLLGGMCYIITSWIGVHSVWTIVIPMCLVAVSNGSSLPLAISAAISEQRQYQAIASGLVGFCQIASSALISGLISQVWGMSTTVLATSIALLSIIAWVAGWKPKHQREIT
ncbi:multidrug effflux MFS transporter [Vibrio profundum]|uniref:multidrug effflux MFS transporter n=1 Tax=Vibrio profundum TaxID=2910247 RepID=UPI003D0C6B20